MLVFMRVFLIGPGLTPLTISTPMLRKFTPGLIAPAAATPKEIRIIRMLAFHFFKNSLASALSGFLVLLAQRINFSASASATARLGATVHCAVTLHRPFFYSENPHAVISCFAHSPPNEYRLSASNGRSCVELITSHFLTTNFLTASLGASSA